MSAKLNHTQFEALAEKLKGEFYDDVEFYEGYVLDNLRLVSVAMKAKPYGNVYARRFLAIDVKGEIVRDYTK